MGGVSTITGLNWTEIKMNPACDQEHMKGKEQHAHCAII